MRTGKLSVVVLALCISFTSSSQILPGDGYIDCLKGINFEKFNKKENYKPDSLRLLFFQDFSDTVSVEVDGKVVSRRFVYYDSTLRSTLFSGIYCALPKDIGQVVITISYQESKKYLKFSAKEKYYLYGIHSSINSGCRVSGEIETHYYQIKSFRIQS